MRVASGDIWESGTEGIVVPCNCAGVPRGFLYDAIGRYPALLDVYKRNSLGYPGFLASGGVGVYLTPALLPSTLFLMASKEFAPDDGHLDFVRRALPALQCLIAARGVRSIAVPAIGCSRGGEDFDALCEAVKILDADVVVYRP